MSGIGAFTLPFLKRLRKTPSLQDKVTLHANDINLHAVDALRGNIEENSLGTENLTISCEDAKKLLPDKLKEITSDKNNALWIVVGGTPNVTEEIFLPLFNSDPKFDHPLILTVTSKGLKYKYEEFFTEHLKDRIHDLNNPLNPIEIKKNNIIAFTMYLA